MSWVDIELARPWILWLGSALPLYAVLRWRQRRRATVAFAPLQYRQRSSGRWLRHLPLPIELLLIALTIVGIAEPYRARQVELLDEPGVDIMLVLDISLSMLAEDFPPNRLAVLRQTAREFIDQAGPMRLGIVIFAGDVHVQTPMTSDRRAAAKMLESVTVYAVSQSKSAGTAIGDALLVAADRLLAARVADRDQAVVLITDGESNAGSEPSLAARYLRDQEIHTYLIGIGGVEPTTVTFEGDIVGSDGSPYQAVLDDRQLRDIAELAEGRYFRAIDGATLSRVFTELARLESAPLKARIFEVRTPLAHRLAFAGLPLLIAHLLLAGLWLRRPYR